MIPTITPEATQAKAPLLEYFRQRGAELLAGLRAEIGNNHHKELAAAVNKAMNESLNGFVEAVLATATKENWHAEQITRSLLTLTYCSQVAMLDLRNEVWPYEYMAFSRRVGELWEHFVRLPFTHAVNDVRPFVPPLFAEVRSNLRAEIEDYIQNLPISPSEKQDLIRYYQKVWTLVDSGEISLQLDLHAMVDGRKLNIDFKSGFGSNEKGNTNRLLMVATIYQNLGEGYENILLVRAREDLNNHYFQTLKRSTVWDAYCGAEAYAKIGEITGFDLQAWIVTNLDWAEDLRRDTVEHFRSANLMNYLQW